MIIEHSCPYIDDILNWLDPEERPSELTLEDIKNHLEKIRDINDKLRSRCVDLERDLQHVKFQHHLLQA